MSRFALDQLPRVSSKTQLVLVCLSIILMNSERIASELLYVEPPSFKIEEKIGLETILSCETGAFQNKQNSETWCDSTKEDGPHQTSGNQRDTCSACNPLTNAPYSIKSVLTGSEAREWRSLLKDKESTLQEVNITINFPQVLEIQSISVKAGKTPLPAVWALETTIDVKSDFQRVHYYVTNPEDCLKHFGVRLLDNGLDNPVCNLQPEGSWTESKTFLNHLAASVQLRFMKMLPVVKTSDSNSDYYSISEISIEGRCVCNGHADECSLTDDGRMACHCLHNTCGERCQFCCEGYSRDDNGDCEGRPKNISTGNSTKTTLAQTIGVPRYVEEKERSPKVISTTDNSLNRTIAEAISGSSTVKSTAVLSTKEIRAGTSTLSIPHDLSTVSMPSTENVAMTLIPTRERRLSEPASMHTALENLTRSTTMKVITDATTVETDTETTIMADITESTRVEITTKPTIVERTTRLTAMEVTLVPTTLETTTVLTTVETTPVPTTVKTSVMSTPVESTAMSTTVKTTTLFTTVETAIMPTTVETTDMPTTVKTTIMPTTVERITEPTKVETSTVPISVKTTSEPAYLERTTESSFVERTTESTTMEASVVFTTKESTTMPTTVETTTTESSTVETTTESSVVETTTSSTVESTTESSTKENTTESSIVDATTESSAVNITASFTVETTASSTMDITESSTVGTITLSSTVETTSESSTKETTTESSTVDTNVSSTVETTVSSSVETTASSTVDTTESSTMETTTESSTVDNNESSTMETTTESSTVDTAASSTVESTTESSTKENTTESSIVDATTESSTVNITASSTVETTASSTMDITESSAVGTITESSTVETTTESSTKETTTESSTVDTNVSSTVETTVSFSVKTTASSTVDTTESSTMETTTESSTVDTTSESSTVERTASSIVDNNESSTMETTTESSTVDTAASSTVDTTGESSTVDITASSTVETTNGSSTLETTESSTVDITASSTVETTTESSTVDSTASSTVETTASSIVKITSESSTVETSAMPTTVEKTIVSSTVETTTASSNVVTTADSTIMETTTIPTSVETKTMPTSERIATESPTAETMPNSVEKSTESTTVETTIMSTTAETTTESSTTNQLTTVETGAISTTVETKTMPTTLETTTMPSTVETTTMPTTVETTTMPSTVETTTMPSTVETTTMPTTVETTTMLSTVETTTMPTTVETTTAPPPTVPTKVETITVPTTGKTIKVPTTGETKNLPITVPTTVETTTESTTVEPTTMPNTMETTTVSTTTETTTIPTTVETTTVPTTVKTTKVPTTVQTTTVPTAVKTTTVLTTVKTVPTTPRVLSEEELRKIFDFPPGVCYCSRFATVTRQCFPTALNKPCICRANFAGTRCERCAPGYFSYPFCAPCRCNKQGSASLVCDQNTGHCSCKPGVRGRKCDACPVNSYGFPTCTACDCNFSGSYGGGAFCDPYTGQCPCRYGFRGKRCDQCPAGYYNFPNCQWCGCNPLTTTSNICEDSADGYRCLCKPNYEGLFCGQCKKGYYGFPVCKRCSCSPRGYGSCNELGKCVCNEGYAGIQCDRCANGYYGFPNCRACSCNTFGSYSRQCNYTTGECSCKPNIRGSQCDRCEENMVGFPACVKCDCNADGTRFLPGLAKRMCYGSAKYQCLCKSNVVGRTCDRCTHGFYNFSGSNPLGCRSCGCSLGGTVSGTRNCHAQNGRCDCKNHVIGKKCQNCRDGYHGMKSHDIFGCKACKCDPGGSVGKSCVKHLGNCQCISGVRGKKCDSLYPSRATYFPTLYHTYAELERAVLTSNTKIRVPIAADDGVFPSFSGVGYAIFPPFKEYAVVVQIPKTSKYHVIFHYALRNNQRTSAKVELYPRASLLKSYSFEVQFPPRKPSEQRAKNLRLTVNKRGVNREFELDEGAWTVAVTSHSTMLLLDYIVFLPQDYYNADLLNDVQPGPCMLRTSKSEHCDMYTYYDLKSPSVSVSGSLAYTHPFGRQAYLFTDALYFLDEPKLSNMALLGESQPILGFDITVPESGAYVVMVTYVHPERFIHRVFITVGDQRGTMEILPCRYQFLCRQFAMDGNKRPKTYEFMARQTSKVTIESSASAKIGVSSITVVPQAKWNIQYVEPRLLCRMVNKTCYPATYPIPENVFQLVAFSRRTKDKMTSIFNGAVKAFVSYRIIIHYRQSNSLSKKAEEISIAGHEKPNIPVTFHYCPADPGCRVVVGEEEALSFLFNRGIFTATIQHERRTQLSYMLLVPENVYSTSLLELQSSDKVAEFLQNCGKDHFHIHPVRGRQCRQNVFSLTMRFLGGPSRCMCNVIGSRSPVCEEFGGQCLCRANVVGRKCDRCKLGHSGFPRCRRCGCHDLGSVSPTCFSNGRCRCKPGFGGYKCNRCISSTYYGFPNCKPCACNTRGSLSTFCRSRDGQCQCRRNFNGKKCNECRIGYYDFPSCKKCNCEAAGIKLLPGEKNGCGSVNNTNCRCKDNVMGDKCDSCKPFHFNLHINNPLGCQSCGCNTNGTLGSIKTCHETTGQCSCKSHVIGRHCDQCKDGYYSIEGPNAFGCKRCSCNAGGSISPSCNEITGKCPCLPGIGGNQCDRVTSNDYYYPTLHQYKIELEDAVSTDSDRSAYFRYDESEFPGFSWRGYAVFSQSQKSVYAMITVPRTSKYQLVFYYLLSRYATVTALVRFTPTLNSAPFPSGSATEQRLDVRFRATSNWFYHSADFLVVRDTWGDAQQIMLSQGKWKFTMSASATDLFVDYMVLLPEEYYKPKNLVVNDFSPCKISGDDSHCSHFAFLSLKQDGFVTIQAEDSSVVGGVLRNRRVTDIPFHGRILTGSRNVMSFRLPSKVQNQFVLLASYFHNSDNEGISAVVVKTGSEILRAQMRILSCRYRFGCRQVAIDKNHGVAIFTASQNEETTISMTTSLTIALDFITAVPLAEWTQKLLLPAAQCISNGFSCIQSAYFTPKDAVKIEAEGKLNGGDRAPYYIMDRRARLKHLKVGEKTVHINGKAPTGRYYVIVHFYQPNFLSFLGKVVISGQNAASTLLTFHYCPHVSGCRAIGTSQYREGMRESIYVGRQNDILVSIAIPEDKGVWIDYVLLVPISSFSPSLLDVKPIDITQDFIQDCGQRSFFLKESTSQFCLRSAFILTTRFNGGALSCNCDSLGAIKTGCQPFGGQCVCRPNVIGRACDRCRSGYSGFPFCRR